MFQNPELKLGDELFDLLFTTTDCTPLAVPFFYKSFRKTQHGLKISCKACNKESPSGIVEGSQACPYCEGLGYEWDEKIGEGWFYKNAFMIDRSIAGSVPHMHSSAKFDKVYLATTKDHILSEDDIVLKPVLDSNKNINIPIKADGLYKVFDKSQLSSDQSNSEFNLYYLTTNHGRYFKSLINHE